MSKKEIFTEAKIHCCLDFSLMTSAVYDAENNCFFGAYLADCGRFRNSYTVGKWPVKDGVISKDALLITLPDDKIPQTLELVKVDGKPRLIVSTVREHDRREKAGSQQLWVTDFLLGGKELTKQIDLNMIVKPDTVEIDLSSWNNMLFVRSKQNSSSSLTSSIDIFIDLKYSSKLDVPFDTNTLRRVTFSEKYVVINSEEDESKNLIRAYSWSPEKRTVGSLIFGPSPGCHDGGPVQLSPCLALWNIFTEECTRTRDSILGIYNFNSKKLTQLKCGLRGTNVRLVIDATDKLLVVNRNGYVYELK